MWSHAIITIVLIGWAVMLLVFGGMLVCDMNLQTFKFGLTEDQATGIIQVSQDILRWAVLPLIFTNLGWMVLAVTANRNRDHTQAAASPDSINPVPPT